MDGKSLFKCDNKKTIILQQKRASVQTCLYATVQKFKIFPTLHEQDHSRIKPTTCYA